MRRNKYVSREGAFVIGLLLGALFVTLSAVSS
jgi:hypothetical protein